MAKNRRKKKRKGKGKGSSATLVWTIVSVVAVVVAAMLLVKLSNDSADGGDLPSGAPKEGLVPPAVMSQITGVPSATLDSVGAGTNDSTPPDKLPSDNPALSSGGKPEIVYIGAEYCPFCAAQRWPLVQALSRFGTFSGLSMSESGPAPEVFPSTQTVSFYGSSYESDYLVFTAVETETTDGQPLENLNAAQQRLVDTYNAPPYVPEDRAGGIPFLYIGGRYLKAGTSVNPELLQGMTFEQIAGSLRTASDPAGRGIIGSANLLAAAICEATGGKPADVCTIPGVTVAAQRLVTGT